MGEPLLTPLSPADPPLSRGPQKPVWWRLGEKPGDITWPVYSVGSSESHLVTTSPGGEGPQRSPCSSTGPGPGGGQAGPASCKGRAGHGPSSQPESEQPGPPLLPPRALSLSSAGPEEVGWAQQRRGCHGVGTVGGWAGLVRGTCLTCRCQDVGRAASLSASSASPFPPGFPSCPFPSSFRSAGRWFSAAKFTGSKSQLHCGCIDCDLRQVIQPP